MAQVRDRTARVSVTHRAVRARDGAEPCARRPGATSHAEPRAAIHDRGTGPHHIDLTDHWRVWGSGATPVSPGVVGHVGTRGQVEDHPRGAEGILDHGNHGNHGNMAHRDVHGLGDHPPAMGAERGHGISVEGKPGVEVGHAESLRPRRLARGSSAHYRPSASGFDGSCTDVRRRKL